MTYTYLRWDDLQGEAPTLHRVDYGTGEAATWLGTGWMSTPGNALFREDEIMLTAISEAEAQRLMATLKATGTDSAV